MLMVMHECVCPQHKQAHVLVLFNVAAALLKCLVPHGCARCSVSALHNVGAITTWRKRECFFAANQLLWQPHGYAQSSHKLVPHVSAALLCLCLRVCLLQLFELLTTFVEKPLLKPQVAAALKDMMYVTIAYLQMTQVHMHSRQQQCDRWLTTACTPAPLASYICLLVGAST